MSKSNHHSYQAYLICPACGSHFVHGSGSARRTTIKCVAHGHIFPVDARVPNLLAPRYTDALSQLATATGAAAPVSKTEIASASAWLSGALGVEANPDKVRSNDRVLRRLLHKLTCLLKMSREGTLSDVDVREIYSILAAEAMSGGYRRHVADPAVASMEAVNYEKYEDILLRKVMNNCLSRDGDVALVELGSGPGRLLHQYGSTISRRANACVTYRRLGPELYHPNSLVNGHNLSLVLGIDFVHGMLHSAAGWLRRDHLDDLVTGGTLSQLRATVRNLPVNFENKEWASTTRVACILFQTLGNQIGRDLQIDMLKAAKQIAGEKGVVFVSVFNANSFEDQGLSYYGSIRGSVGDPWYLGERAFLSKRGVYSRWFETEELKSLFRDAGMANAHVLDEESLEVYPDYEQYIDVKSQQRYRSRALIGVYTGDKRTLL